MMVIFSGPWGGDTAEPGGARPSALGHTQGSFQLARTGDGDAAAGRALDRN
jgi:hypothetical protein